MNQNKRIIDACDRLVSKIVIARDPFCFFPYCNERSVDPCHIWGRTNMATRFNPIACKGGCREHHNYADTHPNEKTTMFMNILGHRLYDKLDKESRTTAKNLPSDLKDIKKHLQAELKTYQ